MNDSADCVPHDGPGAVLWHEEQSAARTVIGREVPAYKLRTWLLAKGYAEEKRGYGHVDAEELADALLATWDVRYRTDHEGDN